MYTTEILIANCIYIWMMCKIDYKFTQQCYIDYTKLVSITV